MPRISHRRWKTSALLALTLALLFSLAFSTLALAAEPLVQISSDPYTNPDSNHKTQVEPDTFAFGHTIVSVFQSGRFFNGGASNIGWATSTNAGETWTHGFLPGTTDKATPPGPYPRVSDPSIAYDAKHKVWITSYLGLFPGGKTSVVDVLASRSPDGIHWGKPVVIAAKNQSYDKNWTVCDDSVSSPFYGHCYTEFDNLSQNTLVQMSTSTDGGKTWGLPKTTANQQALACCGQPVVQPNGTVVVPIIEAKANFTIFLVAAFRSTDGGASWSSTVKIASQIAFIEPAFVRNPGLLSAEIDAVGRVYLAWSDCRFEPGCRANDIVLSTSTDGLSWSPPKRVPIDPRGSGIDHITPGIGVDTSTFGSSAHIGLTYYSLTNANCSTATCQLKVGFISSINGGASWSNAEQLAGPMNLTWLPRTSGGYMFGDYISTSIVPGDDDATPVFAVARPPTGATRCSAPGAVCHVAMFTTPEDLLHITGGTNAVANETAFSFPASPQPLPVLRTDF